MQTFLLFLILLSLIIPLHAIPTLLHQSHFVKHSLQQNNPNTQPQEYFEVTGLLPSDGLNASCTFPILTRNFGNTYGYPSVSVIYSPPVNCRWSNVVLELQFSCHGKQQDRIAAVWLNGVELIRTSTAQPTADGIFWKVRKDVTRYSSLLTKGKQTLSVMLENIVNNVFTGVFQVSVTFLYYDIANASVPRALIALPGENEYYKTSGKLKSVDNPLNLELDNGKGFFNDTPADLIIPISSNSYEGFWFKFQKPRDIRSKQVRIPRNTYRAVIEIYVSFHGDDEFWYFNPPDAYFPDSNAGMKKVRSNPGHGAYREVLVKIDGELVGSVIPFPVIYSGGFNPLFWEPVVGMGAFDLPSYDLELTPFLGLLLDGKVHSFSLEVADGISFWLVDANLHLWFDPGSLEVRAGVDSSEPEFSLEREYKFDGLDGLFETETERTTMMSTWVGTRSTNFTIYYEQNVKFENMIKFYNQGTRKSVYQTVEEESELSISGNGQIFAHSYITRAYILKLNTESLLKDNDTYMMTASLENSISEKKSVGSSSSFYSNKQVASGWMSVKDDEVLSSSANTQQRYSFQEKPKCYSRVVSAQDGTLLSDNACFLCVHS